MARLDRAKNYEGTYTSSSGKQSKVRVKVFPIIMSFVMGMTIVKTGDAVIDLITDKDNDNTKSGYEQVYESPDMEAVNKFLKENPYLLKNKVDGTYVIQFGDSLSEIAEANGITLKRLLSLNPELNSKSIIRPGDEINVETVTKLDDIDSEIAILESYLNSYVLYDSTTAQIARREAGQFEEQQSYYKSILFGANNDGVIDPNSIQGRIMTTYLQYHDEDGSIKEGQKENYLNSLTYIKDDLMDKNKVLGLIDYEQFKIYCKNGNTNSQELEERHTTVYD